MKTVEELFHEINESEELIKEINNLKDKAEFESFIRKYDCEATADEIKSKYNVETIAIASNVTKLSDCENLIAKTLDKFQKIDILVTHCPPYNIRYKTNKTQ